MLVTQTKRIVGIKLLVLCMLFSTFFGFGASVMAQTTNDGNVNGFKDLGDSYAQSEIQALADAGIISGFEGDLFKPREAMTRAQLAKVLVLAMGLQEDASTASVFSDVPKDAWYRGYVGALTKSGVTQGTSADHFSPDKTVTREELAAFFIRSFGLEEQARQSAQDVQFSDLAVVSDWAKADVSFASKIGFIGGMDDGKGGLKFQPKDTAERQALARLGYEFKFHKSQYISKAEELKKSGSAESGASGKDSGLTNAIIAEVLVISSTNMEVVFNTAPDSIQASDFTFDNGLTVTAAAVKSGMPKIVSLTTNAQMGGQVYTLTYKGTNTGIKATGIAGSHSSGIYLGNNGNGNDNGNGNGSDNGSDNGNSNPFPDGGVISSDYTISSSGTYGPVSGTATINGTLTVDPGPTGEVTLRNVVVNSIEVKSGAENSIHFVNVLVPGSVNVNTASQTHPVHVVTEGSTSIGALNVNSPSTVNVLSSGTIDKITVGSSAAGSVLELGTGNHVQNLNVQGNLTLNGDFNQVTVKKDDAVTIGTNDSTPSNLNQLLEDLTNSAKVAAQLLNQLTSYEASKDFDLPTPSIAPSLLEWTSSSDALKINGNHVTVTRGSSDVTVTLTAKIQFGKALQEITVIIKVKAQSSSSTGLTLAQVRNANENATVATAGVVTTKSDTGNTFYMQDETGGILVYLPTTKTPVNVGDQVNISSGVKITFSGEIELKNAVFTVTGQTAAPTAAMVSAADVPTKGGQLVSVQHLIVSNLSGSNFDATDLNGTTIKIFGQKYSLNYNGAIKNGDIVDVTGISVMFNTTVEVYPRSTADVIRKGQVSDADKVQLDKNALTLGDVSAVYADLTLTSKGANGSNITWTTSDASIVSVTGQVYQPAYGQADKSVVLTATLNLNGNTATRTYDVKVKSQLISDVQAVANEKAVLYLFYDGFESGLVLTNRGVDATKVTWQLANPLQSSIVNVNSGAVARTGLSVDTDVILNATITRGTATQTKSFTITVKAVKDQPVVNPLTINDMAVTGKAKEGTTVSVLVAGSSMGTTTADAASGNFSIPIAKQKAGTVIEVLASGTSYASDSSFVLVTDQSGADLSVSTSTPTVGQDFTVSIANAKDVFGKQLNGSTAVSITSNVYGSVYSANVMFSGGKISLPITLNQAVEHKLTVQIAGVTSVQSVNVTVSESGPVTLANGGFEAWTAGKPDGWFDTTTGSNITAASVTQVTYGVHSGSSALQLKNTTTSHLRFTSKAITLTANKEYTVTYWAKGSAKLRNSNALVVNTTITYDAYSDYNTLTSTWQQYTYKFTPKTTGNYGIIFSILGIDAINSIAQIDDVTITTNP